jgi:hypothetical protein
MHRTQAEHDKRVICACGGPSVFDGLLHAAAHGPMHVEEWQVWQQQQQQQQQQQIIHIVSITIEAPSHDKVKGLLLLLVTNRWEALTAYTYMHMSLSLLKVQ